MSSIEMCHSSTNPHSSFDLEGLEESLVDNNENDDEDEDDNFMDTRLNDSVQIGNYSPGSSGIIFDHNLYLIREALIRDSASRTEDDIEIIVRFLSIINSNHDHMTRRRLAPHFVLAEIEARDTRVLTHGEKLDAYCIVAAGSLRHVLPCEEGLLQLQETSVDDDNYMVPTTTTTVNNNNNNNSNNNDSNNYLSHPQNQMNSEFSIICPASSYHLHHQNTRYLHVGDEFGAHLDDRVVYGEIFTNEDFVWVLCVPHIIFDQICGEKTFKTIRDEVTGNIIEMRANCLLPPLSSSNQQADINSLGSTNLTASDLSLSQQSEANKSQSHFDIPEEFVTEISIQTKSSAPLTSISPQKSLPKNQSNNSGSGSSGGSSKSSNLLNDSNELIRATKERLYELLLNSDPNEIFIEDFLLTFRIWSEKDLHPSKDSKIMADLMSRICTNIRESNHVENCVRIVLIWLVNHYQDFQNENRYLLDEFESVLKENSSHKSQLRLFYMHLSAKSLERQVTVTRSDRNSPLIFSLIGGYECSARLFIGEILTNSPQHQNQQQQSTTNLDLRPGDRVISINGVDCHVMPIGRAYELCRSSTHLSLQVKYDPHLFYALIEGRHETKRQIVETFPLTNRLSTSSSSFGSSTVSSSYNNNQNNSVNIQTKDGKKEKEVNIWKQKVRSFVSTTNHLISSNILNNSNSSNSCNNNSSNNNNNNANRSMIDSNSSNSSISYGNSSTAINNPVSTHPRILSYEVPEIIKIYSFEHNDCCFLPIHSSTTVRECIQLALRQFKYSNNYSSRDFALYEYSVIFNSSTGVVDENSVSSSTVVKRLNDGTNDLVNNLGLNSRLYLKLVTHSKDSNSGDTLSDSDIAKEIVKDSSINSLLTLKGYAIARELTARDFRLFCKIEAQQFVYDLAFNDPNNSSQSNSEHCFSNIFERTRDLQEFERKTNEEMFWTINQVLGEKRSITKRVKAIKQLIRIATLAMKLNNYNTLFAIISGLMHLSVSRLKTCWDKVPAKHLKQLQKLQQLMDPSRNFYNFRQQLMQKLREDNGASIIIPFFPLVKKDLSFIWLANQTYVNSAEPQTPSTTSGSGGDESSNKSSGMAEMLVNWEKMRLLSEKIREIQKMANTTSLALAAVNGLNNSSSSSNLTSSTIANEPIDPNLLFRIFADASSLEHKSSNDHKKLWENQRMAKRVQSFLDESFSSISSDEHELMSRSYSCELPQTPNSSSHAATTRSSIASTMSSNSQLSHPSPTPSSASSSSNSLSMNSDGTPHGTGNQSILYRPHRPKFGQTSPKQLRKLLALSDGAVIVPHSTNNNSSQGGQGSQSGGNHHSITNASHSNHIHLHHHHHNHHNNGSSNSRMSTSNNFQNSNTNLTSSSNYYNNIYGCHPHHNHQFPSILSNSNTSSYGNGSLSNTSSNYVASQLSKTTAHYSTHHMMSHPYSNMCCSMGIGPLSCCSSNSQLFPNQPYCSCYNNSMMMRPSMIMMPPPQTSGLMHSTCPCMSNNTNRGGSHSSRGRQSNSLPPKQSLPVESSSVTSLRRLDQYQQMARHRGGNGNGNAPKQTSRRPQCPDYDTTMQRICGGSSSITINGNLVGGSNQNQTNMGTSTSSSSKHHRQPNHREDIV